MQIASLDSKSPSVSEYLGDDHRRLDAILKAVGTLVEAASFDEAASRFAEFSGGLSRHIDVEEQVLFPAFEQAMGRASGPTAVMRAEHVEIRQRMQRLEAALGTRDGNGARDAVDQLEAILGEHNLKEERILYPGCDRAAGDDRGRADLVKRLRDY
jgi:iron-sulfur cluster repair protein YtfE (RIC family)